MNTAVILAGGTGSRVGAAIPKQYLEVRGVPIIAHTLRKFQASSEIDMIEVVCASQWKNHVKSIGIEYGISKLVHVAEGGLTCQESIRNGILALRSKLSDDDILLLHMSISPLISSENIAAGIKTCREKGNAFAARSCLFCMCRKLNQEWSDQNAYKEDFVQLNMPWIMNYGDIYRLYSEALTHNKGTASNDYLPSLMYSFGMKTYFYPDNDENMLKITTRADIDLFEAYLYLEEQRTKKGAASWANM